MNFSFENDLSPVTLLIMMIEHVRHVYAPFAFPIHLFSSLHKRAVSYDYDSLYDYDSHSANN